MTNFHTIYYTNADINRQVCRNLFPQEQLDIKKVKSRDISHTKYLRNSHLTYRIVLAILATLFYFVAQFITNSVYNSKFDSYQEILTTNEFYKYIAGVENNLEDFDNDNLLRSFADDLIQFNKTVSEEVVPFSPTSLEEITISNGTQFCSYLAINVTNPSTTDGDNCEGSHLSKEFINSFLIASSGSYEQLLLNVPSRPEKLTLYPWIFNPWIFYFVLLVVIDSLIYFSKADKSRFILGNPLTQEQIEKASWGWRISFGSKNGDSSNQRFEPVYTVPKFGFNFSTLFLFAIAPWYYIPLSLRLKSQYKSYYKQLSSNPAWNQLVDVNRTVSSLEATLALSSNLSSDSVDRLTKALEKARNLKTKIESVPQAIDEIGIDSMLDETEKNLDLLDRDVDIHLEVRKNMR